MHKQTQTYWSLSLLLTLLLNLVSYNNYAQLPEPSSFCSHLKSSQEKNNQTSFNYESHDAYDIHFYYLNLWAETENTFLSGFTEIQAQTLTSDLDTVFLELTTALTIDSVVFNNQQISFTHQTDDILYFSPVNTLPPNQSFRVRIYYHGFANNSGDGRGYNSKNSYHGTRVNWTLSEPFYSKDWWVCKQDLQDKADSVWVFVSTSNNNKVGSNGLLTASIPLGNYKVRYEWKSNYPIDYYLISFAMAEYMEYSFSTPPINNKSVWIQNYLYPDSAMYKSQKTLIDCTNIQMNLLREKYGEYPFIEEKYGHCITPIGGGMEHQTMTTQANFNFHLTIHEMGHSWFGDQVTCASWSDIWINEGFATYTQYIGLEYLADIETANAYMAAIQSIVMREPDGSVYVPFDELDDRDRIFSGRLSYYKGATIIHMIRYLLADDEMFYHVLQEFQNQYAYQTATGEDFKNVLEDISGRSFDAFFELWYYGEGFPIYYFDWKQNVYNEFEIFSQQESSTSLTPFFDMEYNIKLFFTDGTDTIVQIHQQQAIQSSKIQLNKTVRSVMPNPYSWNLMEVKGVYSSFTLPDIISIEPNPANNMVLLRFANYNHNRHVSLYSASLQFIEEAEAYDRFIRFDISNLPVGVYFFRIDDGKQLTVKKLIKY